MLVLFCTVICCYTYRLRPTLDRKEVKNISDTSDTRKTNMNKTCVIHDPLGQCHSLASSHCFHLKFVWFSDILKKYGRTDGNMYKYSDHCRPGLWSASWINSYLMARCLTRWRRKHLKWLERIWFRNSRSPLSCRLRSWGWPGDWCLYRSRPSCSSNSWWSQMRWCNTADSPQALIQVYFQLGTSYNDSNFKISNIFAAAVPLIQAHLGADFKMPITSNLFYFKAYWISNKITQISAGTLVLINFYLPCSGGGGHGCRVQHHGQLRRATVGGYGVHHWNTKMRYIQSTQDELQDLRFDIKNETRLESYNDPRPSTNQSTSLKSGLTLWSVCFVFYRRTDTITRSNEPPFKLVLWFVLGRGSI